MTNTVEETTEDVVAPFTEDDREIAYRGDLEMARAGGHRARPDRAG